MLNKKIIIGGAQLGNRYGIFSDKTKMTNETEIKKIFNFSIKKKLKYIDTAHDYGHSDVLDTLWSDLMHVTLSRGNDNRDQEVLNEYLNWLAEEITNFICQNNNISKKDIYNYCLKIKYEK